MKITLNNKDPKLFTYYHGELHMILNIEEEYKDEVRFKNSAFVTTGRKVPTGNYIADKLLVNFGGYSKLSFSMIESKFLSALENQTQNDILKGFIWNGFRVWLSEQNQQNYTSWAIALNSGKENLFPLNAKFNDAKTNSIVYYEFSNKEEFDDFYSKMVKHINDCVKFNRNSKQYFYDHKELYKRDFEELKNF